MRRIEQRNLAEIARASDWGQICAFNAGVEARTCRFCSFDRDFCLSAEGESGIGFISFGLGDVGGKLAGEVGVHHGLGIENELAEGVKSHQGAGGNEPVADGASGGVPRGAVGFKGHALQGLEGGLADAARGGVDDTLQGHGIVGIANKAEVGEQVLDLSALVKAESANHGVGDVVAAEGLFDQARLGVGAVQHRSSARSAVRLF